MGCEMLGEDMGDRFMPLGREVSLSSITWEVEVLENLRKRELLQQGIGEIDVRYFQALVDLEQDLMVWRHGLLLCHRGNLFGTGDM